MLVYKVFGGVVGVFVDDKSLFWRDFTNPSLPNLSSSFESRLMHSPKSTGSNFDFLGLRSMVVIVRVDLGGVTIGTLEMLMFGTLEGTGI